LAEILGNDKLRLLELAYRGYANKGIEGLQGDLQYEFNHLLIFYQQEVLQNYHFSHP